MEYLEEIDYEKIVIFSQFESTIKLLEERVKKLPRFASKELGYVYACNPTRRHVRNHKYKDLKVLETAFQEDESVRIWMGTLKTGGESITLTAARYLIRVDRWWNAASADQADGRIDRGGQTKIPIIIDLEANDTIEQLIQEMIDGKKMSANEVLRSDKLLELLRKDRARSRQLKEDQAA